MKDKRKVPSSSSSASTTAIPLNNQLVELKHPSMTNPLQQAVFRGCVECIQILVETPPYFSVDSACGPEGLRPIHIASREGHINTLRYLTATGACLLKSDYHGFTALHHASIGGQLRAVRWLLRHGAEIVLDKRGRSPIQVAADNDHMEIVSLLAKHTTNLIIPSSASSATTQALVHCSANSTPNKHNNSRRSHNNSNPSNGTTIIAGSASTAQHNYHRTSSSYGHFNHNQSLPSHAKANHHNTHKNHNKHNNNHNSDHHLTSCISNNNNSNCDNKATLLGELSPSSSGNSSLATLSNSPSSLSPSSATTSCTSCLISSSSDSSSSEDKGGGGIIIDDPDYSVETTSTNCGSNSTTPFYLHPPKSSISSRSTDNPHSHHKRSNSSFYLHPPSSLVTDASLITSAVPSGSGICSSVVHFADIDDSDIEIQEASTVYSSSDNNTTIMAPVTPNVNGVMTDFIPGKVKSSHETTNNKPNSNSSSPSPPPLPPPAPPRTPNSKLPVRNGSPAHNNANSTSAPSSNNNCKVAPRKGLAPPPPPPPPMPNFPDPPSVTNASSTLKNIIKSDQMSQNEKISNSDDAYSVNGVENDYEDIDEMQNCTLADDVKKSETAKRLNRSISAPATGCENPGMALGGNDNGVEKEKSDEDEHQQLPQNKIPSHIAISAKIYGIDGKPRVPFIPPNFPDPPKDALIKPSEYLKSIQQQNVKGRHNSGINGIGCGSTSSNSTTSTASTTPSISPISKVEECIKLLNVNSNCETSVESGISGSTMQTVLEESSSHDDDSEQHQGGINSEKINDVINISGVGGIKLKNCQLNGGGGNIISNGIKSEELSKVNLRKTPTSRTVSAPVLGRVLPEKSNENLYIESCNNNKFKHIGNKLCTESNTNGNGNYNSGDVSTLSTAIIAELSESSQVGGVREWKEELRRRHAEMEKAALKEMDQVYSPLNFVAEVPSTDVTGVEIPPWKRQMLAKKVAEKARKEAEEQRRLEAEAKRLAAIPPWRRQLLQRRESTPEGKYS